ncbi:hypothetical protein QAD02_009690 [Eretmocerus hayati]|uniref:Uncharacterized protein n=1 Tax=Eretmocerus hayati TaxID=131215 RepID=A0ACC2NA36_9HYME|nr:hypothetical protein QAD02_009690 [Eretmocerus hayati]
MRGLKPIKSLQKKMLNKFIDDLTELFLTNEEICDGVLAYIFQNSETSSDLRKIILKHLNSEQSWDKNNMNRYDRAVTKFKHSIINTIQLKLAQCEDYMETNQDNCILASK